MLEPDSHRHHHYDEGDDAVDHADDASLVVNGYGTIHS
jgi:hypothetical protein